MLPVSNRSSGYCEWAAVEVTDFCCWASGNKHRNSAGRNEKNRKALQVEIKTAGTLLTGSGSVCLYVPFVFLLFIFFYFFLPVPGCHLAGCVIGYHGAHGPEVGLHAGLSVFIFYSIFLFDADVLRSLGRINVGA